VNIGIDVHSLRRNHWNDYAIRFLFGGLITAFTGLIAKWYGPMVAGLFLAFPAILPASATLIEKHEIQRKHRSGLHGTARGRTIASVDAAGASMGSIGLVAFGLLAWKLLPHASAGLVLAFAALAWFAVSFAVWRIRKLLRIHRAHKIKFG
jgi:hypothetical protein